MSALRTIGASLAVIALAQAIGHAFGCVSQDPNTPDATKALIAKCEVEARAAYQTSCTGDPRNACDVHAAEQAFDACIADGGL